MMTFSSPAKLNLFLHITGQRPDGYHTVQTLFQRVDLCDTLDIEPNTTGLITVHDEIADLEPEANLIFRAAQALKQFSHIQQKHPTEHLGASITLNKKIPMGGGLGGGSSNAATTLLALNKLWSLSLTQQQLAQIGLTLGADVPIFVNEHSAWAEGIGEIQTPLSIKPCYYLIITPPCHASTKHLFAHSALNRAVKPLPCPSPHETIDPIDVVSQQHNVFEPVVRSLYPEVNDTLNWLSTYGPAALTGTGSSCFIPFHNQAEADAAYQAALKYWCSDDSLAHNLNTDHTERKTHPTEGKVKMSKYRCFLTKAIA